MLSYSAFTLIRSSDWVTVNRNMPSFFTEDPNAFSSGRLRLWELAVKAISSNPLGYGFDGFGLAYPYLKKKILPQWNEDEISEVLGINAYTFTYRNGQGELKISPLPTNKAHNIFLDLLLSTGIAGAALYLYSLAYLLSLAVRSKENYLGAVGVAYLAYGLTWFECAQFSHLAWWALAAGAGLFLSKEAHGRFNAR